MDTGTSFTSVQYPIVFPVGEVGYIRVTQGAPVPRPIGAPWTVEGAADDLFIIS